MVWQQAGQGAPPHPQRRTHMSSYASWTLSDRATMPMQLRALHTLFSALQAGPSRAWHDEVVCQVVVL